MPHLQTLVDASDHQYPNDKVYIDTNDDNDFDIPPYYENQNHIPPIIDHHTDDDHDDNAHLDTDLSCDTAHDVSSDTQSDVESITQSVSADENDVHQDHDDDPCDIPTDTCGSTRHSHRLAAKDKVDYASDHRAFDPFAIPDRIYDECKSSKSCQVVKDPEDYLRKTADTVAYANCALAYKAARVPGASADRIPQTFDQAWNGQDKQQWRDAIHTEWNQIVNNNTFTMVRRQPSSCAPIKPKWIFDIKYQGPTKPLRYKARLVAKGYSQVWGRNYEETFAPVGKLPSFRALLAHAAANKWYTRHLDISTAFLYGHIDFDDVMMEVPQGAHLITQSHIPPDTVCHLHKGLYGLKQSPRLWMRRLVQHLLQARLQQSQSDPCLFYSSNDARHQVYLCFWVDDILIVSPSNSDIDVILGHLSKEFKTNDLGPVEYLLGMTISLNTDGSMFVHQLPYLTSILEMFDDLVQYPRNTPLATKPTVGTYKLVATKSHKRSKDHAACQEEMTSRVDNVQHDHNDKANRLLDDPTRYRTLIGLLLYAARSTRPDLSHSVSILSRYVQEPRQHHLDHAKHVLEYILKTITYGLVYRCHDTDNMRHSVRGLSAYTDADWGAHPDSRKSTSGYMVFLHGNLISWKSKLQTTVATCTQHAEYIALFHAGSEVYWLKHQLCDIGFIDNSAVTVFVDNQPAIKLSDNPRDHESTKHLEIKYHKIRQWIHDADIKVAFCPTTEMMADILTKQIGGPDFHNILGKIGICKSNQHTDQEEC